MNALQIITSLIENPFSKKMYKDLKEYCESAGRIQEAEAIGHLIEQRYGNSPPNNQKQ
jgi:hypothetical protein